MKQKLKILVVFAILIFAVLIFSQSRQQAQTQIETAGQKFKNIKVLNEMPADQMGKVMNLMAASLGVNCSFCHIGNNFEKDGNEHKDIAREMLKMTFALNKTYFEGRPEVSCATCHNGLAHPQSAPNLNLTKAEMRPKQPTTKPTIDQILDKYALALGGKTNLEKITSRYIKANRVEPDGTTEPEEVWQKSNKILIATKYGDYLVTEAFDGTTAWKRGNADEIKLKPDEEEQIRREAGLFASANLTAIYPKMEFGIVDKIDGREVYQIRATTAGNLRERLYFDVNSGLLVRRIASTPTILGNFPYQVDYHDYKNFGGVKLPTTVRFALPNIVWTRKILEVKINTLVDDAKFKPTKEN
ncbi:MAG: c-type cytochrome [Pyrinomonadaceae bacterium]|nr:c-type cytochrome [Pyrinomonadaceae bacterium]